VTWTPTPEQRDALNRARQRARELRDGGANLNLIAFTLTTEGHPTVRGGPWSTTSARRLIENPPLPEASVSYGARHARVRVARGKAKEHQCVECGRPAQVWAQIHDTDGLDPMDYKPMCQKCHLTYDGIPGSTRSAETRAKMSAYARNRTPEHRAKMIEAHTGVKRTGRALENIRRGQEERRRRERGAGEESGAA
jgi:hypothetical protein